MAGKQPVPYPREKCKRRGEEMLYNPMFKMFKMPFSSRLISFFYLEKENTCKKKSRRLKDFCTKQKEKRNI